MVNLLEFEIHFVPAIGVPPRMSIVVVTRDSDVTVTRSLRRRKDGKQYREGSPVREKVAMKVMGPRVVAEGVGPMEFCGKTELISWTR